MHPFLFITYCFMPIKSQTYNESIEENGIYEKKLLDFILQQHAQYFFF